METVMKESFNTLVFENRNKSFGAYSLRRLYSRNILVALGCSVLAFSLALVSPVIYNKYFKSDEMAADEELVVAQVMDIKDVPKPKEVPPPPIEVPQIASIKFPPLEIKPDEQVVKEEEMATIDELKESTPSDETREGEKGLVPEEAAKQQEVAEIKPQEEEQVVFVDQVAEFPGGDDALKTFLANAIHYTPEAKAKNIQGVLIIEFVVDKEGKLSEFKVLKSLGYGLDEAAMQVVKTLPNFKPGLLNGEMKRSKRRLKIPFTLK